MKKNSNISTNTLPPVQREDFMRKIQIKNNYSQERIEDYYQHVSGIVSNIKDSALGPFFWYVLDFNDLKTKWMSDDMSRMTSYCSENWKDSLDCFVNLYHQDDQSYILSAILSAVNMCTGAGRLEKEKIRFNIYGRMMDSKGEYRWTLLQLSKPLFNRYNEIESLLSLVYDLSYLRGCSLPLLSVMDYNGKETLYYKYYKNENEFENNSEQFVTKREKEILYLIAKGYNTPQISEKLYISYHTVEKHKCNLRKKTNTKTLSELMVYALTHNLLCL